MMFPRSVEVLREGWDELEMRFWFPVDQDLLELARRAVADLSLAQCAGETCLDQPPAIMVGGNGVSGGAFIDNAVFREYVFETFQAQVLDMESAAVAHVAYANNVPFIAVRSLSDLAGGGEGENQIGIFFMLAADNAAEVVKALLDELDPPPSATMGSSTDDSGRQPVLLGAGLGLLGFFIFDPFGIEQEEDADAQESVSGLALSAGNARDWFGVGAFVGESIGPRGGLRTSITATGRNGLQFGLTITPAAGMTIANGESAGERLGLQAGWDAGAFFARIDLSSAGYRGRHALQVPGRQSGMGTMRHDHAAVTFGSEITQGGLRLRPSLSLFTGALDQDAYAAHSAAFSTEVPALSQDYRGWTARLALAPAAWQHIGEMRWRPRLALAVGGSSTDSPSALAVRRTTHSGAFRFDAPAEPSELPTQVQAAGIGIALAGGPQWRLNGGYVAMWEDGTPRHGVGAKLHYRF